VSIFASAVVPAVTSNIIRGNAADRAGGGLEIYHNAGVIAGNTILENEVIGFRGHRSGGGIQVFGKSTDGSPLFIMNNLVLDNRATTGGGGVDLLRGNAIFRGNNLFDNFPVNLHASSNLIGTLGNVSLDPNLPLSTLVPGDGYPSTDAGIGPVLCVGDTDPNCLSPAGDTVVSTLNYGTLDFYGRPRLLDGNGAPTSARWSWRRARRSTWTGTAWRTRSTTASARSIRLRPMPTPTG